MEIREVRAYERDKWLGFRERLWPDCPREQLEREQDAILADAPRNAVLMAVAPGGELVGFAEVALRDWAEGCSTRPVGYLEAWYGDQALRQQGIGRMLVQAAESWARARGCTEMGSDADPANEVSQRAHRALGYAVIGHQVLFTKKLA